MRRQAVVRAALMLITLAMIAIPTAGKAAERPLVRYSDEWLAKYHSFYDTPLTATYESRIRYGLAAGSQANPSAPLVPTNIRMSNPGFANNQNEFQIDINPTNHLFAIGASNDSRTSGTGYYRTSDGGKTWFAADMPGIGSSCCDPGIAYADDGTAYFINLDASSIVVHFMKSIDNGVSWVNASNPGVEDRPNVVVDNGAASPHHGRIYLTFSNFGFFAGTNDILAYYSDNGVNWTGPINVSHTGFPSGGSPYAQSSQPRVANDGTLYVGYQIYPNGTKASARDMIAKSTDGGVTFQPARIINAGPNLQGGLELVGDARGYFAVNGSCVTFRHRGFPIIGVDPTNSQNVYAAWAGGNLETAYTCGSLHGFHSDILFAKSTDGGATWSAPLKINDDASGSDQYYPWMDVAPNGKIWIGWHDRRNDASNFRHVYYVDFSTDGGLTFGVDRRVGNFRSLPSDFIGDYAGLAAENDIVLPMWWDSRNSSNGDPYTARIHG
jgi:hypothetical protein